MGRWRAFGAGADPGDSDSEVAAFVRQVPNERLRLMALTRFDDETVREYLAIRIPTMAFDGDAVARVSEFTKGLPLAVSLVADLLAKGAPLDVACAEIDRPTDSLAPVTSGQVVSALARRFLMHVERLTDDQAKQDLHRILCLAVANGYPTRRPEVLRALWDCGEGLYEELQGLANRHDFVLSGSFRLHDDVRDALRFDLLDPIRRQRVQPASARALEALNTEISQRRTLLGSLQDQIASEEYLAALLDYVWYSFWEQPQAGWRAALTILPVLSLTNPSATDSLLSMLESFVKWGGPDDARLFGELAQPQQPSFLDDWLAKRRGTPAAARLSVRITRSSVDRLARLEPIRGLLGSNADHQAALSVMQMQLALVDSQPNEHSATIQSLRQLSKHSDPALAQAIARTLTSYATTKSRNPDASVPELILAAQALAAADDADPQPSWALGTLALELHTKGDAEAQNAAEDLHKRAIQADPNHANALGNYAVFLKTVRGDHDAAEDLYKRAIQADPNHANTLGSYANFLTDVRGDHDAAEDLYKRAIQADPNHANTLGNYAVFLKTVRGDHDAAEDLYKRAIQADPNHANTLGNYAVFLKTVRGDHDAAEDLYKRAIQADPNHANNLGNYANFLTEVRGDHDAAEDLYKRAIQADPNHANNLGNYAVFLKTVRGDHDAAEDLYKRAIQADPNHANNLGSYANFLTEVRGDHDAAEDLYKRAIQADPNHANALGNYAVFLKTVRGDHDAAEDLYKRAIQADPNHANNLGSYANFLTEVRGDHDAAEDLYKRAIQADPNHANALGNYAVFLKTVRGDHDAAEDLYKRAIQADPNHANNLGSYANFLTDVRGDHDAAEDLYKRAIQADPNHANNLGNYARLLFILGRDQEAERLTTRSLELANSEDELPLRAECSFYLFMHVEERRTEAGIALKGLLADGVATGTWSLRGNLDRLARDGGNRLTLLTAVAEALRVGNAAGLDQFSEWREIGTSEP